MKSPLKCFISAGEHSGDLLGASLVAAFRKLDPSIFFFGLTGKNMRRRGVYSIADMNDLNVMGIVEILKRLPNILKIEKKIIAEIERQNPDFIILIDYPGFHFRLAEQLKLRGFKVYQYVAPKVWAWGEKRIPRLRRDFQEVLGIFPFETEFFANHQVPYKYIGSPLKDRINTIDANKEDFHIPSHKKVITCLPGSRMNEVNRIMPVILELKSSLEKKGKDFHFTIPVAENLSFEEISKLICTLDNNQEQPKHISEDCWQQSGITLYRGKSLELMAIADFAIVTSGTATLECALLNTPMVVVYSMNALTYKMAQTKVKIPWVSLVNILAQKEVVKEFIQEFTTEEVVNEVMTLLNDNKKIEAMKSEFRSLSDSLTENAAEQAASQILSQVKLGETHRA